MINELIGEVEQLARDAYESQRKRYGDKWSEPYEDVSHIYLHLAQDLVGLGWAKNVSETVARVYLCR